MGTSARSAVPTAISTAIPTAAATTAVAAGAWVRRAAAWPAPAVPGTATWFPWATVRLGSSARRTAAQEEEPRPSDRRTRAAVRPCGRGHRAEGGVVGVEGTRLVVRRADHDVVVQPDRADSADRGSFYSERTDRAADHGDHAAATADGQPVYDDQSPYDESGADRQ